MLPPAARNRVLFQHFLHAPFPEPDDWARLPADIGAELLRGLLGNDVIGFQLPVYGRRFLACCQRYLGLPADEDAGLVGLPDGPRGPGGELPDSGRSRPRDGHRGPRRDPRAGRRPAPPGR